MEKTVVLSPEEARRQEWEEFVAKSTAWEKDQKEPPCPKCGARKGYNPITGVMVRSHIGREAIEGHRDSCPLNTASKSPRR